MTAHINKARTSQQRDIRKR